MAIIRELGPADLARAHEINDANVPEVGEVTPERLGGLHAMAAMSLGVFDDHALVGFCMVLAPDADYDSVNYRWFMDRYTDAWYLDRVAFDASARRRGFGTLLYDHVEDEIRRRAPDVNRLTLEVNLEPPNEPSVAFHTGRGFVEVGRQPTPYGAVVSLMEKPLR